MKRSWMKKTLALGLSAVMAAGALTGCGVEGNVREEKTEMGETAQLNVYNLYNSLTRNSSGFYELVEYMYGKEYPEVEFNYRTSAMDYDALTTGNNITPEIEAELRQYYQELPSTLVSEKCEDVILVDNCFQWFEDAIPPDYNRLIDDGKFVDLKPLLTEVAPELDLSLYNDLLVNGQLFAVPVCRQPYYLFSTEGMLKNWGFDFNAQDDVLTFLRKCVSWQETYENSKEAPVVFTKQAWEYLYHNIFNIMGVSAVDYQNEKVSFDQADVREALELLKALKSDYDELLMNGLSQNDLGKLHGHALFGSNIGSYSSYIMMANGYNYLNDPAVLVPLLQLDGKTATTADMFLMIPENAPNKLNAARYVALVLKSVVSYQKREGTVKSSVGYSNTLFSWDAGEAAFDNWMTIDPQLRYTADGTADTVKSMYQNQGRICMPCYWFYNLKDMFDEYMEHEVSTDKLISDVQAALETIVTK